MDAIKRRSIVVDYKSIEVKMKLLILHLSDIHFTVEKNYDTVNIFAAGELCNKGCWEAIKNDDNK